MAEQLEHTRARLIKLRNILPFPPHVHTVLMGAKKESSGWLAGWLLGSLTV